MHEVPWATRNQEGLVRVFSEGRVRAMPVLDWTRTGPGQARTSVFFSGPGLGGPVSSPLHLDWDRLGQSVFSSRPLELFYS